MADEFSTIEELSHEEKLDRSHKIEINLDTIAFSALASQLSFKKINTVEGPKRYARGDHALSQAFFKPGHRFNELTKCDLTSTAEMSKGANWNARLTVEECGKSLHVQKYKDNS